MNLTLAQANAQLVNVNSAEELRDLIRQIDVSGNVSADVTLLYSGPLSRNEANTLLSQGQSVRVIDQTDASKFLDLESNPNLVSKLEELFPGSNPRLSGNPAFEFLDGQIVDGVRTPNGAFDIISKNFVDATVGDVRVIINDNEFLPQRILAQTEIPALLNSATINSVEGIPLNELKALANDRAVLDQLTSLSSFHKQLGGFSSGFLVDDVFVVTPGDFLNNQMLDYPQYIIANPDKYQLYVNQFGELTPERFNAARSGAAGLSESGRELISQGGSFAEFNKLSIAGFVAGLGIASYQATTANTSEEAVEIMTEWAISELAGQAGTVIGTALGSMALAIIAAVSGAAVSPVLASVTLIAAGVAGGFFLADDALDFYNQLDDLDNNGRRDVLDSLAKLLFGPTADLATVSLDDVNNGELDYKVNLTLSDLIANAQTSEAWRFALKELNPFVVEDADYSKHNVDGSLDIENFSQDFIADRSAFLILREQSLISGGTSLDVELGAEYDGARFVDLKRDIVITNDASILSPEKQFVFGTEGDDLDITGSDLADRLYGQGGVDFLDGGAGDDLLEGGKGDDFLTGGTGDDRLKGGEGADQYIVSGGDIITDSDGLGFVHFNDVFIVGGSRVDTDPEGQYKSEDERIIFQLTDATLTVTDTINGDLLTIEDFDIGSSSLGITLSDGLVDNGGFNVISGTESNDTLNGTAGRDDIRGLGGDDNINGDDESDLLTGGTGEDVINGETGDDEIEGGADNDTLMGKDGNDVLRGDQGVDYLFGGAGDDLLFAGADGGLIAGGAGVDTLVGGDGIDVLYGDASENGLIGRGNSLSIVNPNTIDVFVDSGLNLQFVEPIDQAAGAGVGDNLSGGAGDDILSGGVGNDVLSGGDDDDILAGGSHDDFLSGGSGNDIILGDESFEVISAIAGKDTILAGDGDDLVIAGLNNDSILGGSGNDIIHGDDRDDSISGGDDLIGGEDGDDQVFAGGGDDIVQGGAGEDQLRGESGNDIIDGGSDDDLIFGGDGDDVLEGGAGADEVQGGADNDTIRGGAGNDLLAGQDGDDVLDGDAGNDELQGGTGEDVLSGGAGQDTLFGQEDADVLDGGDGNDIISGGDGNDVLQGGAGDDLLDGGAGNDVIIGGAGNDTIAGGDGDDSLQSGAGDTQLDGGAGNDIYIISPEANSVDIAAGTDNDTLRLSGGFSLADLTLNRQNGNLSIIAGATTVSYSNWGDGSSTSFELSENNPVDNGSLESFINDAPEVGTAISDQTAQADSEFIFQIDSGAFVDEDDASLQISSVLPNNQPLPAWLSFDPATATFSGTPSATDVGAFDIEVSAADANGLVVTQSFSLQVAAPNTPPELAFDVPNRSAGVGLAFSLSIPDGVFIDADEGDSLSYSATLADDSPLPSWLTFDPDTQEFSGTPTAGDIGSIDVKIIATDLSGESASDEFKVTVANSSGQDVVSKISNTVFPDEGFPTTFFGERIAGVGDINGDGYGDVYISSTIADSNFEIEVEQRYFVFMGQANTYPGSSELLDFDVPSRSFTELTFAYGEGSAPRAEALGDINGDGFDDFAFETQSDVGTVVVFGGTSFPSRDFNNFAFGAGFKISPDNGNRIKGIGDINGDGFADFIRGDEVNRLNPFIEFGFGGLDVDDFSGEPVTLVLGRSSIGSSSGTDLGNIVKVDADGDFNNDGRNDPIFINSQLQAYITFEEISSFSSIPAFNNLNNIESLQFSTNSLYGTAEYIGDFNGDGIDDVLVVADSGGGSDVFVVFGQEDLSALTNIDLTALDGSNGFALGGLGFTSVISAGGDVDGDGRTDLLLVSQGSSENIAGTVVFGRSDGFGGSFDVGDLTPSTGFEIEFAGETEVRSGTLTQDLNGDGFDDIVLGNGNVSFGELENGGEAYVIYGRDYRQLANYVGDDGNNLVVVDEDGFTGFTLGGDDTIEILSGIDVFVNAGGGNDTFDISGARSLQINGGPGSGTYRMDLSGNSSSNPFGWGITSGSDPSSFFLSGNAPGTLSLRGASGGNNSLSLDWGSNSLGIGQGSIRITSTERDYEIILEDLNPEDVLNGPRNIDTFIFTDAVLSFEDVVALGFDIPGTEDDDSLSGTNVVDRMTGLAGNDSIQAGDGNDVLTGGTGNDVLNGNTGDDTYNFAIGDGQDIVIDAAGADTISFATEILPDDLSVEQSGDDLSITYSESDSLTIQGWFLDPENQIEQFLFADDNTATLDAADIEALIGGDVELNLIVGTSSSNILVGTEQADQIEGLAGNDTISGAGGDDVIIGGAGNDTLNGGDGDDSFLVVGTASTYDTVTGGEGIDSVLGSDGDDTLRFNTFTGEKTVEIIDGGLGINTVAGTSSSNVLDFSNTTLLNISLIDGGSGNDNITGTTANDVIMGGVGNDTLNGGDGDDSFLVVGTASTYDTVTGGEGIDSVLGGDGDDTLRFNTFTGTKTVEILDGGLGNNTVAGTSSSNVLDFSNTTLLNIALIDGGSGNDNITGTTANDVIMGGAGNDTLNGGDGDDSFLVVGTASTYDTVTGGEGVDSVLGGDGDDTLRFNTFTGTKTVEILDGGLGNNTVAGTSSSNVLDFSNTTLLNIALIDGGSGNDNITGTTANDVIMGGAGNDTLNGGDGDDSFLVVGTASTYDTVTGGEGVDSVLGGDGDDTLRFNTFTGTKTVEILDGGLGNNTVAGTSSSNVLDFSNTTLLNISLIDGGSGNDNITGTTANDVIMGGAGNDTLNGGDGDDSFLVVGTASTYDTVTGGEGIDSVLGGDGDDTLRFNTFTGAKTVEIIDGGLGNNTVAGTSSSNVLDFSNTTLLNISLIDGGSGNDNITGTTANDVIMGGAGNDTLNGGDGNDNFLVVGTASTYDTVTGGEGIDSVLGSEGDDTLRFNTFTGTKTVEIIDGGLGTNTVAGTSSSNVLDFSNTTLLNISLIDGGSGNDNITGTTANDVIMGGTGNDTLRGGEGNDTYTFSIGDGRDTIFESGLIGDDDVLSFSAGIDHENLWFTKSGDNLLIGQIGSNDEVTIRDWFASDGNVVESIVTADAVLDHDDVLDLVNAMANFNDPTGVGGALSTEDAASLQPFVDNGWMLI